MHFRKLNENEPISKQIKSLWSSIAREMGHSYSMRCHLWMKSKQINAFWYSIAREIKHSYTMRCHLWMKFWTFVKHIVLKKKWTFFTHVNELLKLKFPVYFSRYTMHIQIDGFAISQKCVLYSLITAKSN